MALGKAAVQKDKETEKEKKERQRAEVQDTVNQIRALMRQEQGTAADSSEWAEFERALTGFLNGDVKGNAATLSIRLLDNIKAFSSGKKNYIQAAKGQQIAQKLHQEMSKVPGALEDPTAAPLITFLGHVAAGDRSGKGQGGGKKRQAIDEKEAKQARKALEDSGWEFAFSGPKKITVEEGKKEQEEAMEAVRKLHEALGAKSPEEIKKEQQDKNRDMGTSKGLV